MELESLIAFINEKHGRDFTLTKTLKGGYQEGAFLLQEGAGKKFVLKQTRVPHATPIIKRLRGQGYPTPDFVIVGDAPDGTPYLVQEFAEGVPMEILTRDYASQLIRINHLQTGINRTPEEFTGSYSEYAHRVVYSDESGFSSSLRAYSSKTKKIMERIETVAHPFASVLLPNTDAVHGDWSYGNILTADGQIVALVDCAYMGYGTRAVDLATLLHYSYGDDGLPDVRAALQQEILSIGGVSMLTVLLLYRVIMLITFSIEHHGDEGVDAFVDTGWRILYDLAPVSVS